MKFVMIKEYDYNVSKDKIVVGEIVEKHTGFYENGQPYESICKYKITIAYLLKMGDFEEDNEYNILYNTDSIQIRPKAIYKNNIGYYKKDDNKRVYFDSEEVKDIELTINEFKEYLDNITKIQ